MKLQRRFAPTGGEFAPESVARFIGIRTDGGGGNGVQNLKGAMTFPCILVINLPIKMEENLFI